MKKTQEMDTNYCKHKFEIIEKKIVSYSRLFFKGKEHTQVYVLQCKNCAILRNHVYGLGDFTPSIKSKEGRE